MQKMSKQILFLFALIIVLIYSTKQKRLPKEMSTINPNTTIFAFDLHNVILVPRYTEILRLIWHDFFTNVPFSVLFDPAVWKAIYGMRKNALGSEYILSELQHKYPQFFSLEKLINDAMSAQDLNNELVSFIKGLKAQGYSIFILSSIWKKSLKAIFEQFPELENLFDGIYIPSQDSKFSSKSYAIFYEGFKNYLAAQGQGDKQIIFVDNSFKNVERARTQGMKGYTFTSTQDFINTTVAHMN